MLLLHNWQKISVADAHPCVLQVNWTMLKDALPHLPSWASKGLTWGPQISAAPAGGDQQAAHSAPPSRRSQACRA